MTEWEIYWELEPFGAEYSNLTVAMLTSLVASFTSGRRSKATDWLPKIEKAQPGEGGLVGKFKALMAAMPGVFKRVK